MKSEKEIAEILQRELSAYRMSHILGVVGEAEKIARIHGEDVEKARLAALLHDSTKETDTENQLKMIRESGILFEEEMTAFPQLLHAVSGSVRAKKEFDVSEEVASAIRWHATGRPGMTKLEMIVYLADLTEPTRRFAEDEDTRRLRALAYKSLEAASAYEAWLIIERERVREHRLWHDTEETYAYYQPFLKEMENENEN